MPRTYTKDDFIAAVSSSTNIREVLGKLNLAQEGANYKGFYRTAKIFNIDVSMFNSENNLSDADKRKIIKDEEIIDAVKNACSFCSALTALKLNNITNANNKWIRDKINLLAIDTNHFTGKGHLKGKSHNWNKITPLNEILVENSDFSTTSHLKMRLIRENLLKDECGECQITEWRGKKLSLHLDHINGVNTDNRIENLRLLCPNCHSLTDTYTGKNKRKEKSKRPDGNELPPRRLKRYDNDSKLINNTCLECKIDLKHKNSKVCFKCYNANRDKYQTKPLVIKTKIEWMPIPELLKLVEDNGYSKAGRILGVSDNAIRKHIKTHSKNNSITT